MEQAQRALVAYGWDHLLREILAAALLTHGWRLVGPHTQTSESGLVDLVLVYCPGSTVDIETVHRARAAHPSIGIVLLGGEITDPELLQFIEAGVGAYVGTHQEFQELLDAMQMVLKNRSPSSGRMTRLVVENIRRLVQQDHPNAHAPLTLREKEVLSLITTGFSNKEIADHLSIAPNTVKNHVHNLLEKLNVRSRHEAAALEMRSSGRTTRSLVIRTATGQ
jgi:DNA-binding NarL/FixJ family response regulator